MSTPVLVVAFVAAAALSLAMSHVMVPGIEALGERLALSEALLGMLAALAADTPEITSAVTAVVRHQPAVGAGVVIGSNLFNLAALLGLGALIAGRIAVDRLVVVLVGTVAIAVAATCLVTLREALSPTGGLVIVAVVLLGYAALCGQKPTQLARLRSHGGLFAFLADAAAEEDRELSELAPAGRFDLRRGLVSGGALVLVVGSSVVMERSGSELGTRYAISGIVIGALVLAAVTSLPNAVAGVYLARRGRGSAALSTAFNSNAINSWFGLLLPAAIIGSIAAGSGAELVAGWYVGLTVATVVLSWCWRGIGRLGGSLIILGYVAFVITIV